jgi:hypothetical protein
MISIIRKEYHFLEEIGYQVELNDITFIYKQIIYSKSNLSIIFHCELMEHQFDVEILVRYNNVEYVINDKNYNTHNTNVTYKSIFIFTQGLWDDASFQIKKEEIYKKKSLFRRNQKVMYDFIILYRELIKKAIKNIENCYEIQ